MVYVDKTSYIAELARASEFLFFLRPRRFDKSLIVSQLYCNFDVSFADEFDELFSQTWIGQNSTPKKIVTWCFTSTLQRWIQIPKKSRNRLKHTPKPCFSASFDVTGPTWIRRSLTGFIPWIFPGTG